MSRKAASTRDRLSPLFLSLGGSSLDCIGYGISQSISCEGVFSNSLTAEKESFNSTQIAQNNRVRRYSTFEIERRYSTEVRKVQSEGTLRKKYRRGAKPLD